MYAVWFCQGGRALARAAGGGLRFQRRTDHRSPHRGEPREGAAGLPARAVPDRLHLRRPVFAGDPAAGGRGGACADRGGQPGLEPACPYRAARAGGRQAVQLRGGGVRRAGAGAGAQALPAQLRRILRKALVQPRAGCRPRGRLPRAGGAVWRKAAVPVPAAARLLPRGRALRGSLGPAAAQHRPCAGRGHPHRQPLGQRRDGRQGRVPAAAGVRAVGPAFLRVPLRRRRTGRIQHRHGVCRPRPDRRERPAAGRERPLWRGPLCERV